MENIEKILKEAKNEIRGFKIKEELANNFVNNHSESECLKISKELFESNEYQIRSFVTFILGNIAHKSKEALFYLKNTVSKDNNWRVQEILAKAFDKMCLNKGYEKSLPIIEEWLNHENPNVRRAVTEGLRIWTGREYFNTNPMKAIKLLSNLKNDRSEYVRKSVGNALRDISKKHKELVKKELENWKVSNKEIKQVYNLANKFINKER